MADLSKLRFNGTEYNVKDASAPKRKFDNTYAKTGNLPITSDDTPQSAIGKLEKAIGDESSNILYAIDTGAKNLLNICRTDADSEAKIQSDGSIIVNHPSSSSATWIHLFNDLNSGDNGYNALPDEWKGKYFSGIVSTLYGVILLMEFSNNGTSWAYEINVREASTKAIIPSSYAYYRIALKIDASTTLTNFVIKPMIADEIVYDTVGADQPPALPNSDLTRLEAEDRASLAEVVDSGAKNLLNISKATFGDRSKIKFNSDGSVTGNITDDTRYWNWGNSEFKFTLPAGTYIFYCKSTAGSNINWGVALRNSSNTEVAVINPYTGKDFVEFTLSSATELGFMGKIFDRRLYTMLCSKAAFDVSQKVVPYFYQSKTLYNEYKGVQTNTTLSATGFEFVATTNGVYRFTALAAHSNTIPDILAIYHASSANATPYLLTQITQQTGSDLSLVISGIVHCVEGGSIALYSKYDRSALNTHGLVIEKVSDLSGY